MPIVLLIDNIFSTTDLNSLEQVLHISTYMLKMPHEYFEFASYTQTQEEFQLMNSTLAKTVILRKNYKAFKILAIKARVSFKWHYITTKVGNNWVYKPLYGDLFDKDLKSYLYRLNALKSVIIEDTNAIKTNAWVLNVVNNFNPNINREWVTFVESCDILSQLSIEDILKGISSL